MKRWHDERRIAAERARVRRQHSALPDEPRVNQVGRFRKRTTLGCGQPRCCGCHSDRYPVRVPTRQEIAARLKFSEDLRSA